MGGPGSGRKPTPTLRLVAEGGASEQVARARRREPKPAAKVPEPPEEIRLDPLALAEWNRVGGQLYALGIISDVDRATFSAYCFAWSRYISAERAIAQERATDRRRRKRNRIGADGLLTRGSRGNLVQNPAVRIVNEAGRQLRTLADALGMTPSGRSKIKVDTAPIVDGDDEEDDFDS